MGTVLLCTGKYAKNPYHFEKIGVNVFCVEELCYLLLENPFLIDAGIIDKKLAQWLYDECDLKELAHQLLSLLGRGCQPGTFADTILDYVQYCSQKERDKISKVLKNNASLTPVEKKKKQGDFLMENNHFQMAIDEYGRLLYDLPETESGIAASLNHNIGVAFCHLFQFEIGAKYLKKAYELSGNEDSGIQYLGAVRQQMSDSDYIAFIADHPLYYDLSLKLEKKIEFAKEEFEASRENRMLSALKIYRDEGNTASYYEEIDKIISQMKEDYRQNLG